MNERIENAKRFLTGLSFIVYPLFATIAFSAHPNLLSLEIGGEISSKIAEFHNNAFMHFGHFLMVLSVPAIIVVAMKFMNLLKDRGSTLGFIGGVMVIFGALILAIQKTALCLVMSAFDTLPEAVYSQLYPGIKALFNLQGYLAIVYLLALLPVGFILQGFGLLRGRAIRRWQSVITVVAAFGLVVSAAVDIDLFGLVFTVLLMVSWLPLGIQVMRGKEQSS